MILLDVKDYCHDCPDFKPMMHEVTTINRKYMDILSKEEFGGTICTGADERIFGDNVIVCKHRKLCERHVQYLERRSESL